jgi:hypothetical protein
MNVLIGCEFSGIVRDAFIARGHTAISCDLLPTERPGPHIVGDIFEHLADRKWDMLIFFWPCTNMASSGARWFFRKRELQEADVASFRQLMECGIPRIAGENPIGVLTRKYRKWDQIIQPWMFGHGETKATCLWLVNLPLLVPTNKVEGRHGRVWREAPSPDRWKNRSRMLPGIAAAMAAQWG